MEEAGHLFGGASVIRRFPIAVTIANRGIPAIVVTDVVGIRPASTTSFADTPGLILDTATYSTTQADLDNPGTDTTVGAYNTISGLDMGRVVSVSVRPDLVVQALMNGGAAESTALGILVNTSASSGGTVVSDTDVTEDQIGGTVWCIKGNNVGHARPITAFSDNTSLTVTVPFPRALAVNDEFLRCPWSAYGTHGADIDGSGFLQTSTLFTQANATIASGTGGAVQVLYLLCNGTTDSYVQFKFRDHHYIVPS